MKPDVTVKENYLFRRIYRKGKTAVRSGMVVYCLKGRGPKSRLGVTVSKKLGKAVVRNRVRRRFRELFRRNAGRFNGAYDVILVGRTRAADMDFARLERQYLSALEELGMLLPEEVKS